MAYSGVEGAFAHIAAGRIFPDSNRVSFRDFKSAYNAVVNGEADVAVLPIENKSALLEQMNLFINKFNELKSMLETEDVDSMRKMMRHSTERRALYDKK